MSGDSQWSQSGTTLTNRSSPVGLISFAIETWDVIFGSVVALYFYVILIIFIKTTDDQRKFSHLENYI